VNRAGWTGQVKNLINFNVQRKGNVVTNYFKARVIKEVSNIVFGGGVVIVHTNNFVAV
jgi:hypothetical protein